MNETDWEQRVSEAWAAIDQLSETEFLAHIEQLVAELPPDHGAGIFERAAAFDSTGHSDLAVPLYRQALDRGLTGERRRRAVIQLASSLRNLGQHDESVTLLTSELDAGSDHLDDACAGSSRLLWSAQGGSVRRSPLHSRRWHRTCRATSARWPTTPGCSWSKSPAPRRRCSIPSVRKLGE